MQNTVRKGEQELLPPENQSRAKQVDFSFLRPLKPTQVFVTYWQFAAERQKIFLRRIQQQPPPWTEDHVLRAYRFTNAYRASDRVSQFLIRHVIYTERRKQKDVFFRILLFKLFNRIETWNLLTTTLGNICVDDYHVERYGSILSKAMEQGSRIYSAAYIMPSGGRNSGFIRKHEMHLNLLERMLKESLPERVCDAKRMSDAFMLLKAWPTIGDFLAYQFVIDLNYSHLTNFSEMEFVVPGPGAKNGIRKCFSDLGGLTEAETIKFITERQHECFAAVGVEMPTLWGRHLQLIDCQNLFCEVDKYARVVHPEFNGLTSRTRIKQRLRPSTQPLIPWYPPKWGLNDRIADKKDYVPRY